MIDNAAVKDDWVRHVGEALEALTRAEEKLDALALAAGPNDAEVVQSIALEAKVLQRQLKALHRLAQEQDDGQA